MLHDGGDGGANPVSVVVLGRPRRGVGDVVLGVHGPPSRRPGVAGACAGLAAGATLLALGGLPVAPRAPWPPPQTRVSAPLEISLEEPAQPTPTPRPPPAVPAPPATSPRALAPHAEARSRAASRAVEPASAARVLAQEPRADEPVDLTEDSFVVGAAQRYAGGATSPPATVSRRGPGAPGDPVSTGLPGSAVRAGPADRSRPVSLAGESWSCPWPSEAERLAIDEQAVVIRIVARADGSVEAVTVVSDPGHGFGEAAAHCARQARVLPARASDGQAVRATSPPIMVRFTR